MNGTAYCLFETPLGWCGIAWNETGQPRAPAVIRFQLPEASKEMTESMIARQSGACSSEPPPQIAALIRKVRKHLRGEIQDFRDVALDLDGIGVFERLVYEAAREIPAGETRTYGELAKAIGRPAAARAVGQALGKNPVALIVPCHRVLAAGGRPGGFSAHGSITTKARMLAIEGVTLGRPPIIRSEKDLRRAAAFLRARDPRLAQCLDRPIRFAPKAGQPPYATLFEAVVHQQLTPKAATTILDRVKALYPGSATPEPGDLLDTPEQLLRGAGLSKAKVSSLKDLAARTLDGTVPPLERIVTLSDGEIVQRLTSIHGVGRWTVEMLLIFHLGRGDVFPVDDYALRKSIAEVYGMQKVPTPKELYALGESWRPHRTAASLYLWNFVKQKEV